jgi:hypothetical protein
MIKISGTDIPPQLRNARNQLFKIDWKSDQTALIEASDVLAALIKRDPTLATEAMTIATAISKTGERAKAYLEKAGQDPKEAQPTISRMEEWLGKPKPPKPDNSDIQAMQRDLSMMRQDIDALLPAYRRACR